MHWNLQTGQRLAIKILQILQSFLMFNCCYQNKVCSTKFKTISFSKTYFKAFQITNFTRSQFVHATWYSLENKLIPEERKMLNWIWKFFSQRSWQPSKFLLEGKCSEGLAWILQVNGIKNRLLLKKLKRFWRLKESFQ